eukprot:CAMPEP_0116846462 /NCGR_PEP_ID=MMETSP0418-20121206/13845_1 /TAXON_ID=1158023 /ORGANISM="Astrosyne radiata, Strain 13vi08-1A" /LENGTH=61 /DNA_ID=CAMNT_0004477705 /DNA_START=22 /DNA_END=207 /DNA_ORIENTATION=+
MAQIYEMVSGVQWVLEYTRVSRFDGDELDKSVDMDGSGNSVVIGVPGDDTRWENGGGIIWL